MRALVVSGQRQVVGRPSVSVLKVVAVGVGYVVLLRAGALLPSAALVPALWECCSWAPSVAWRDDCRLPWRPYCYIGIGLC